jgi:hypothetical protein
MRVAIVRRGFRIERRLNRRNRRAEAANHGFEYVIAANAQPASDNLDLGVPIAEVPRQQRQTSLRGVYFAQLLQHTGDGNNGSVIKHETVAVSERRRLRQIEQKLHATFTGELQTPAVAIISTEQNAVDAGVARPGPDRFD